MTPETLQTLIAQPQLLYQQLKQECVSKFDFKVWKNIDPRNHKINSWSYRPMRKVVLDDPDDSDKAQVTYEEVNRIPLPLQRLIVIRGAAFLTGGKCTLTATTTNDAEQELHTLVKKVWKKNKLQYKNNQIARRIMSETECAEIWYTKPKKINGGTETVIDLKCNLYSPGEGYKLMPVFDALGDLIAFGMSWDDPATSKRHFHIYVSPEIDGGEFVKIYRYVDTGTGFELSEPVITTLFKKLPVIFYSMETPAWLIVQPLIERLEDLLSNFGDTNDYNGSPILFADGEIDGFAKKGETGKVLQGRNGASLEYVTWESAPESIKLEIDTLLNFIYTCTQTPNISFDQMKGLGDVSGVAFDRIMIDAHLKAIEEQDGHFGECIQRRVNLIQHAVSEIEDITGAEDLDITPVFGLFKINGESDIVDLAMKGNGGKPVYTHEQSIEMVGKSDDAAETVRIINEEQGAAVPATAAL